MRIENLISQGLNQITSSFQTFILHNLGCEQISKPSSLFLMHVTLNRDRKLTAVTSLISDSLMGVEGEESLQITNCIQKSEYVHPHLPASPALSFGSLQVLWLTTVLYLHFLLLQMHFPCDKNLAGWGWRVFVRFSFQKQKKKMFSPQKYMQAHISRFCVSFSQFDCILSAQDPRAGLSPLVGRSHLAACQRMKKAQEGPVASVVSGQRHHTCLLHETQNPQG